MRRVLLLCLLLSSLGCHEIVAIDPPPRTTGRTALWLVSSTDEIVDGQLRCPSTPATDGGANTACLEAYAYRLTTDELPRIPPFARRGVVHLAFVEFACAADIFELKEGPIALRESPSGDRALPRPLTASVYRSDVGMWSDTDPTEGWVDVALRSIPVPGELKCRLRGVNMSAQTVPPLNVRSVARTPAGDVVVFSNERTIRYTTQGGTDDLTLNSTSSATRLAGAGLIDENNMLWLADDRGAVYRVPFADQMTAPRISYTRPAPWGRFLIAGPRALFLSTLVDTPTDDVGARTAVARFDRGTESWEQLHYTASSTATRVITLTDILPLDEDSVVVVGGDLAIPTNDPTNATGSGRLLERTRTSSTWVELIAANGEPAIAVALARIEPYGVVASAIICGLGRRCRMDEPPMRSALFHRVNGSWRELPNFRFDFGVFSIAAGAVSGQVWAGGLAGALFGGRGLRARFDDGLQCSVSFGQGVPSVYQITPFGAGSLFVSGYVGEAARHYVLTPQLVQDEACVASAE